MLNFFDSSYYLILLVVFFSVLERLFPRKEHRLIDNETKEDSYWTLFNEFGYEPALRALNTYLLFGVGHKVSVIFYNNNLTIASIENLPTIAQILLMLIVFDFVNYLIHRIFHATPFLWEIHKLHHSTPKLNALSNFRYSWMEALIFGAFFAFFTGLVYSGEMARLIANVAIGSYCVFAHSNITIKLPLIDSFLITPDYHYWHHVKYSLMRGGQNFGTIFNIWDRYFETYHRPTHLNVEVGIADPHYPKSYLRRAIYPLDKWVYKAWKKMRS